MNLTRMLKTSALALGIASIALSGCSAPRKVEAHLLGIPLTEYAKRNENLGLPGEPNKIIVPAYDVGPGFYRVATKNSAYSSNNEVPSYKPKEEPTGLFFLRFPLGK
ncbi:MAG: hypothetical protein AABW82_02895 [Nanoarchaeota archaeon]